MGESFGAYSVGNDEPLMPFVASAPVVIEEARASYREMMDVWRVTPDA